MAKSELAGELGRQASKVVDDTSKRLGIETEGAKNRQAVRSASSSELESAGVLLLHPGAVIRLFRGEMEAIDVIGSLLSA